MFYFEVWFKNRRAKYRKKQKIPENSPSIDRTDDDSNLPSTSKPAHESSLDSISPIIPFATSMFNPPEHFPDYSAIYSLNQSKISFNSRKYHIESLLQ